MNTDHVMHNELIDRLDNPRPVSRPVAFWFLDGRVTPEEINFQLTEMKSKGVHVVIPQNVSGARLGFIYLSEPWFKMIGDILNAAKRHQMQVWLYDESTTMSGSVEKRLAYGDHWKARAIVCEVRAVMGADSVPVPWHGQHLLAIMIRARGMEWRDVSAWIEPDRVSVRIPDGESKPTEMFFFFACTDVLNGFTSGDVDRTHPEAVEEFLNLTHREYARRFHDQFGSVVTGVFTDEIALCEQPPFAHHFFEEFQRRKGYDFRPYLPALYFDIGPTTIKARCDFYATIGAVYTETFFKKAADWCQAHGLAYTGHLWAEEQPDAMCTMQGDPFLPYRHWDYPGIDHVCGIRKLNPVVPKLASSVTHLHGKKRVMCEAFAGTGLAFRYQEMKWISHWLMVCGVDLMVSHFFYYTSDYKSLSYGHPCVYFQHPGWPWAYHYSDYVGRLSELLQAGTHAPSVAVLYPRNTIWANTTSPLSGHTHNILRTDRYGQSDALPECPTAVQPVVDDLEAVADTLVNAPIDFDFICSESLANAPVENGRLAIGAESYSTVILPHVTVESAEAMRNLDRFAEKGGKVIAFGARPECSGGDEKETAEVKAISERLFASKGIFIEDDLSKLTPVIGDRDILIDTPFVKSRDRNIHYQRRRSGERDIYFLINHSSQSETVHVSFQAVGEPELWDPEDARRYQLTDARMVKGRTELDLDFEPYGAFFVVFSPKRDTSLPRWQQVKTTPVLQLDGDWEIEFLPNEGHRFLKQFDRLFRFETRQAPLAPWSELGMAHFSGRARYTYQFNLSEGSKPRLVLDLGRVEQTAEVTLNGSSLGSRVWLPYRFDVSNHARVGENTMEVIVSNTLGNVMLHPQLEKGPAYRGSLGIPPNRHGGLPTAGQLTSGLLGPVTLLSTETLNGDSK